MIAVELVTGVSPELWPSKADWNVVLARDGTVLAAMDGAPPSWVGRALLDCSDAPEEVKHAARMLLGTARQAAFPLTVMASSGSEQKSLRLTLVEALPVRRTPTDLRTLLRSALEVLRRQAKDRDVTLDIVVDDRVPQLVTIDAGKIAWITSALVGNALRYVRSGSRLMPGGSIRVVAAYDPAAPRISIEVQDNGPGIAADKLPRMLTTGTDHAGVALGLLMVRDIVAAHGGQLEILSETDAFLGGTTIRITLPVS